MRTRPLARQLLIPVVFALLSALTTAGCWDLEEVDEIGIIGSMGLDKGEEGRVIVSLEVINPGALASGTSGGATVSQVVAVVLRDEANTIAAAISNAQRRLPRRLTTGQVNTIICGQALARQGIGAYIDYLVRTADIRGSALLATCDTGAGLLQRPYLNPLPSRTLSSLAQAAIGSGQTVMTTLNEFAVRLTEPGIEPVTMHTVGRRTKDVQVKRQGEEVEQTEKSISVEQPVVVGRSIEGELPDDSPYLQPYKEAGTGELLPAVTIDIGIAAYRDDKLVGLLDDSEARGFLWIDGRLEQSALEVPDPTGSGEMMGLKVIRASSSIKPDLKEGIKFNVEIHVDVEVAQAPLSLSFKDTRLVSALEDSLRDLIMREALTTLNKVQREFRSDIYGFGYQLYRTDPRIWQELEPKWNDEVFPNLDIQLDIQTRLRAPGSVYGIGAG
ncbi:MAG TPA: Ger(x)C family spore germination protein [Firmicutes bacterium]|nr:Ger(x)C family spore germination protein [Candidatus Fermentithermobacillaceae bacterium]